MAAVTGQPKQFLNFLEAPLYWQSARTLSRVACVAGLVFVFPPDRVEEERVRLATLDAQHVLGLPWLVVGGGERRQDSVCNALAALPPLCTHVLVHDAARPFASAALTLRVCEALEQGAVGVIPGLPVTDTVKVLRAPAEQYADRTAKQAPEYTAEHSPEHAPGTTSLPSSLLSSVPSSLPASLPVVDHTPDRAALVAVQTPQGFDLALLRAAHREAVARGWDVTDDASLLERCQKPVTVVQGEAGNSKITTPEDLRMLEAPVQPPLPRTGFGYDVHRFGPGRPLKLGGVLMDGGLEVLAHSDGDVLLHALMDAILGCMGEGDIGLHFPDSSAAFDNADSAVLLETVLRLAAEKNFTLVHADLTIITQKPKIAPQRAAIRAQVARLLQLDLAAVNVKATTEEGLGFTGSGEGIKAVAVVTALAPVPSAGPHRKAENVHA